MSLFEPRGLVNIPCEKMRRRHKTKVHEHGHVHAPPNEEEDS
ncbi:MAG: hypothetical protein ACJ705_10180 [Nitrososphaeraceae archaeon]